MRSDDDLLESFALRGDEAAFRGLVERYAGLVLGIAERTTNDRETAREVAQDTFLLLARKAREVRGRPVAGWLHRTAVFLAKNARRAQMRRDHYRQEYAAEALQPGDSSAEAEWEKTLPLLDALISSLPESERDIVVEHYLMQRPFGEIAAARTTTADAVRKRAARALERLTRRLHARGVTLSVAAAAAGLTSRTAKAAPPGFADAVTGHVLHAAQPLTAGTLVAHSLATMTIAKSTIVAAALALVAPAGWEWLEARRSPPAPPAPAAGDAPPAAGNTIDPRLEPIAAAMRSGRSLREDPEPWLEAVASAGDLPEDLLTDALAPAGRGGDQEGSMLIREALFARMAEFDPHEAARRAGRDLIAWRGILKTWMPADPDAALAAIDAHHADPGPRKAQSSLALKLLALDFPAEALARIGRLPVTEEGESLRLTILAIVAQTDPAGARAWIDANHPEEVRYQRRHRLYERLSSVRPDIGLRLIGEEPDPDVRSTARRESILHMSTINPEAAAEALERADGEDLPDHEAFQFALDASRLLATSAPDPLVALISRSAPGPFRDGLIHSIVRSPWAWKYPSDAADFAADGSARMQSLRQVIRPWLNRDREAATAWVNESPLLNPEERETLLKP